MHINLVTWTHLVLLSLCPVTAAQSFESDILHCFPGPRAYQWIQSRNTGSSVPIPPFYSLYFYIEKSAACAWNTLFIHVGGSIPLPSLFAFHCVRRGLHVPWQYVTIWGPPIIRYAYVLGVSSLIHPLVPSFGICVASHGLCVYPDSKELVLTQITCLLPGSSLVNQWWKFGDHVSF